MSGKHALVTGATGFLGLHLVEALQSEGWQVSALCRPTADTAALCALGVRIASGDVLDRSSIDAALQPDIDVVFHTVADMSVWRPKDQRQTLVNVQGTQNVVSSALSRHCPRVVHVSTIAAFGAQSSPITEDTQSNAARSWINYERTKWLAVEKVREAVGRGLPAMIVAPSAIVGPRDRLGWAKLFIEISRGRVPFCPPGSGTFNDVRQVARALVACGTRGVAGENYLLSGETLTFTRLIRIAVDEIGCKRPSITMPAAAMRPLVACGDWLATRRGIEPDMTREMAAMLCRDTICGSRKAEIALGYRPPPIEPVIRESVQWLRAAGLLAGGAPK
jgi:dihydroflavonol-4-reductase